MQRQENFLINHAYGWSGTIRMQKYEGTYPMLYVVHAL